MNKLLILAAGHGGGDSGTTGQGTTEAAQCIDIVNRVADKIRTDGQISVYVVPHELGLVDTINHINQRFGVGAGYCLEVHKNCCGAKGVEGWFYAADGESARLMKIITDALAAETSLPNRGVKDERTNRHGKLGFIHDTKPTAGLIEAGFIDLDPVGAEANDRYAQGVFKGVLGLWGLSPKVAPQPQPQPAPAPAPAPTPVEWIYRVTNLDGAQIGVYKEGANAWNKYHSVNGSARIYDRSGTDVTSQFVEEFRPKEPQTEPTPPEPQPIPKPVIVPTESLWAWLLGIFSVVKSFLEQFKRERQ